jgi:hypothetical protein
MRARRTPKVTRKDSPAAAKARKPRAATFPLTEALLAAIPTNWIDPLLTGPDAVIGKPPYGCPEIEALLRGIGTRMRRIVNERKGAKR